MSMLRRKPWIILPPFIGAIAGLLLAFLLPVRAADPAAPSSGIVITEKTLVPIGAVLGVLSAIVYLTRCVTKWEDAIKTNGEKTDKLSGKIDAMDKQMQSLERLMATRPCVREKRGECPEET
jgi:hypothetical protein